MSRSAAGVLGLLVALVLLGIYSFPKHPLLLPDLAAEGGYDYFHYFATTRALQSGMQDVYTSPRMAEFSAALSGGRWVVQDNHPLPFYLLYTGLAGLDFATGFHLHLWLGVALFAAGTLALCLHVVADRATACAVAGLLSAASLVTGVGSDNLYLGQVGYYLAFALCAAFVLRDRLLAGVFVALAVLLKAFPLLLVLWYVRRREFQPVAGALGTLAMCGLLAGLLWGFGQYADYLQGPGMQYKAVASNQALMGLLAGLLPQALLKPLHLLLLGAGVVLLWRLPRPATRLGELFEFSAWTVAALILSPLSWSHHHLVMVMPTVAFAARALQGGSAAGLALMCAYFLLEGEIIGRDWVKAVHFQYLSWRLGLVMMAVVLGACLSASFEGDRSSSEG